MRVYEYAKLIKKTSKDVLSALKTKGIELESHMSILNDSVLKELKNIFESHDSNDNIKSQERTVNSMISPKIDSDISNKLQELEAEEAYEHLKKKEEEKTFVKIKKTDHKTLSRSQRINKKRSHYASHYESQEPIHIAEIIVQKEKPLFEVAQELGKTVAEIILVLLKQGMACNRNNVLSIETIKSLANHYGITIKATSAQGEEIALNLKEEMQGGIERWPVVVVMGHVDHGKTTLLDYIRNANVAQKEKGGITQHLGAYEVTTNHGRIVFLDTPGHAAFVNMRKRGASVTDIAILVVAADDGVMPQTIEALKNAQSLKMPIVVAINKIDKVKDSFAAIETIKRQLSVHGLMPEEWGGDTLYLPISAKTGDGINELLEMVVLQSQLLELKAYPENPARGIVLESSLEKGYGFVASMLFRMGTIKIGDYFVCGQTTGRVKILINAQGEKINKATPSVPVKVVGFDGIASAGDELIVVSPEEYSKAKSSSFFKQSLTMSTSVSEEEKKIVNIIVKADTYGSLEVAVDSIRDLVERNKSSLSSYAIIHSGIGDVSEGDVSLALDTSALIIALHVKTERNAITFAKSNQVSILKYDVIYHLIEDLENRLKEHKPVTKVMKKIGEGVVLKVFNIKNVGTIIGGSVKNGIFSRNALVACIRNSARIGEGKITSLQRNKQSVKEVHAGYEFAFGCDAYQDWQVGDIIECYIESPL